MIAWAIEAAQKSQLFDRIIVSTDDDEIATVASSFGAEVPFKRPAAIADDYATTGDVMAHAAQWALEAGLQPEALCCLYATNPLVDARDIVLGHELLLKGDWSYVFTATEFASSVYRSFGERPDGGVEMLFPDKYLTRSQDLVAMLYDAAQFYWGTPKAWLEKQPIFASHSHPLRIPRWRVQDIDSLEDWQRAELIARTLLSR